MFAEIQQSAFAKTKHVPHITEVFKEFRAVILLGNSYGGFLMEFMPYILHQ